MKHQFVRSLFLAFTMASLVELSVIYLQVGSPILALVAGLLTFLLAHTHGSYHRRRRAYEISSIAPFIISEAKLALLATGSLFEVIQHLAEAEFRWISHDFSVLRQRVIQGQSPAELLTEYAARCDSVTLREGIMQLTGQNPASGSGLETLEVHAKARFVEEMEKLGPKLAIATGWSFFVPVILTILLAVTGSVTEIQLFGTFILYLLFSLILRQYLLRKEVSLIY